MKKVLFINACVRPESRTLELAESVLQKLGASAEEVNLYSIPLCALDMKGMEKRDFARINQNFDDPVFDLPKQFAQADEIVVAAPYWDMMFPAVLKTYLENVTVCGLTFVYSQSGRPQGMCKAKSLYYVTTAGGFIGPNDFGFSYVEALSRNFFGISEVRRFTAEGLDIAGANVDEIVNKAKDKINEELC